MRKKKQTLRRERSANYVYVYDKENEGMDIQKKQPPQIMSRNKSHIRIINWMIHIWEYSVLAPWDDSAFCLIAWRRLKKHLCGETGGCKMRGLFKMWRNNSQSKVQLGTRLNYKIIWGKWVEEWMKERRKVRRKVRTKWRERKTLNDEVISLMYWDIIKLGPSIGGNGLSGFSSAQHT